VPEVYGSMGNIIAPKTILSRKVSILYPTSYLYLYLHLFLYLLLHLNLDSDLNITRTRTQAGARKVSSAVERHG
jgi:hypothetical protein